MIVKVLKMLSVILGAFFMFAVQTTGQSDSCFPHKALFTTRPVEIRSSDSYLARMLGKTTSNKTYTVFESKKAALFNSCWIKINDGWLLRRIGSNIIRSGVPEIHTPKPTPTPRGDDTVSTTSTNRCFFHARAYLTGNMNIRKSPNATSEKVGSAQAGQSYYVMSSQQGDTYCWLKIGGGWMAKTGRVSSSKPAATTMSSRHVFADLTVQGPASFKSAVTQALNLLKSKAPSWYNYVIAKRTSIKPNITEFPTTVSFGHPVTGEILIGSTHDKDIGILAGVLVHETCHVHQWDDGRHHSLGRIGREIECMEFQVEAMQQATPGHHFIRKIQELLRDPSVLYG